MVLKLVMLLFAIILAIVDPNIHYKIDLFFTQIDLGYAIANTIKYWFVFKLLKWITGLDMGDLLDKIKT